MLHFEIIIFWAKKHLTCRNLNAKSAMCGHDIITFLQNVIKVFYALFILNLGGDLDASTIGTKDLMNVLNVLGAVDESCKDHVNTILDIKLQVAFVLVGKCWEIHIGVGGIDTLAESEDAIIQSTSMGIGAIDEQDPWRRGRIPKHQWATWLKNVTKRITIVGIDELPWCSNLGKIFLWTEEMVRIPECVGNKMQLIQQVFVITTLAILVVHGNCEPMSCIDGDLGQAV